MCVLFCFVVASVFLLAGSQHNIIYYYANVCVCVVRQRYIFRKDNEGELSRKLQKDKTT